MVRSAIQVVVRVRPTPNFASAMIELPPDKKSVNICLDKKDINGAAQNQWMDAPFRFDNVLNNASQETMYEVCAEDITKSVLEGYNGTIMAYGQTGAGKTFTMSGGSTNYKQRGITPRCIQHIFREIANRPEYAFVVRITYLEIYNEHMYDLLATAESAPEGAGQDDLNIVEDRNGIAVKGLTHLIATSEQEALNFLFEGETNRQIAAHQLNRNSTRSHCVFTIHVESRSRVESSEKVVRGKLNLVDLAGSERVKKTGSEGTILKEALYINKSLTFLEQVVVALADRNRDHVPYRQSKLTNVLKDSLGGNSKTLLVANIWGQAEHIEETVSTLKFAQRMMRISNEVVANVHQDPSLLLKKYEREIRDLKQELAMHDTLASRSRVQYEAYTEEQRFQLQQTMKKWLANEIEELEVVNLRQVKEYFMQFKDYIKNLESNVEERLKQEYNLSKKTEGDAAASGGAATLADGGVGEVQLEDGFGVGVAPDVAKPKGDVPAPGVRFPKIDGTGTGADDDGEEAVDVPATAGSGDIVEPMPSRTAAFNSYKGNEGKEDAVALGENKQQLKDKKRRAKELSALVNANKRDIDRLKMQIDMKKQEREGQSGDFGETEVIDEEEFAFFKELKQKKAAYRAAFDELKQIKDELTYLDNLVQQCRHRLMNGFDSWFVGKWGTGEPEPEPALGPAVDEQGEVLDYGEQFERMELDKVVAEDPDSVSFYNASKQVASRKSRPARRAR